MGLIPYFKERQCGWYQISRILNAEFLFLFSFKCLRMHLWPLGFVVDKRCFADYKSFADYTLVQDNMDSTILHKNPTSTRLVFRVTNYPNKSFFFVLLKKFFLKVILGTTSEDKLLFCVKNLFIDNLIGFLFKSCLKSGFWRRKQKQACLSCKSLS